MPATGNDKILTYINEVCSHIKFREAHADIKHELTTHLEEIIAEYLAQGFAEEEAVSQAIARMGEAGIVGRQLNRVHKAKPEWSLLALSFFFVSLGLVAMYFIEKQGLLISGPTSIFARSLLYAVMGAVTVTGLYLFDYRKLGAFGRHIYTGAILVLALAFFAGHAVNGYLYLSLGPFSINIIGISPVIFCLALAGVFAQWDWQEPKRILKGLLLCAAPLVVILAGGAFPAGIIYTLTCIILMRVSGASRRHSLLLAGLAVAMLGMALINAPYRWQRLTAFINPGADPGGSGYLNLQLNKLISAAGLFGQGFTLETGLLPELHTDLIFAYLTITFGWLAAAVVVALAVLFLARVLRLAAAVKDNYARLLLSGFAAIFAIQFSWNILMNLGFAPISGVGLPFISYGGSQLLANAAVLGLIASIYRRRNLTGRRCAEK